MTAIAAELVPPPSTGDLLIAARTLGWPGVTVAGKTIVGERAWRDVLTTASPALRSRLWAALGRRDAVAASCAAAPSPRAFTRAADDVFVQIVDDGLVWPVVRRLSLAPPGKPLPAQRALFDSAEARARACGLRLPRSYLLRWVSVRGEDVTHHGETSVDDAGRILVVLNVEQHPGDLLACALHELAHVAQCADPQQRHLPRVELERRAIGVAADLMQGYGVWWR